MRGEAREAGNLQRRFLSNHTNSYVSYSHRRDQRPKERGASPAIVRYDTTSPSPSSGKEPETHCGGHDGPLPLKTVGSMVGDDASVWMCFMPS